MSIGVLFWLSMVICFLKESPMGFSIVAAIQALLHVPQTIVDVKALAQEFHDNVNVPEIEAELAAAPNVSALITKIETALVKVGTDAENLRKAGIFNVASRFGNFVADANTLIGDVQGIDLATLGLELASTPQAAAVIDAVITDWEKVQSDFTLIVGAL